VLHKSAVGLSYELVAGISLAQLDECERRATDPVEVRTIGAKLDADEALTTEEFQTWVIAVAWSQPAPAPSVIIDEGEEFPPETELDRAWDDWYARPIASHVAERLAPLRFVPLIRCSTAAPRRRSPRTRRVRRTARGARSPGRSSDSDLDPPPHALYAHAAHFRGNGHVALWLERWGDDAAGVA
jgi:hypothetical protein